MPIKKKRSTKRKPTRKKRTVKKKKVDKTIIFMKGSSMARKKRRKRRSRPRRTYRKRRVSRRRYYGQARRQTGIMPILMQGVGITGGAVGGSMVARMIPIKDARIKSVIPIILGVVLMSTKQGRKGIMKDVALGSTAIGFISLLKTFAPNIPLLAADETELALLGYADDLLDEEAAMLGLPIDGEGYDDLDDLDGEDYDDLDGEEDDLDEEEYMGIPIGGEGISPASL